MSILENQDFKDIKGYKKWIAFFLGLTSTMPIVGIHIGARDISFYRILFLFMIIYTMVQAFQRRIVIGFATKKLIIWLMVGIFSCLCGWIFLSSSAPEWSSAAASNIVRTGSLLAFALFWGSQKDTGYMNEAVCKGFFYGCLINCVWATIDAAGYYLLGRSINNIVFAGYIARNKIRYDSLSLIYGSSGMIRSGGFNSDPAQLGFIAPIVACYGVCKKKYWMLIIAGGAILASASTTALVTSIIVCMYNVHRIKGNHGITLKKLLLIMGVILVVTGITMVYWSQISRVIGSAYSRFSNRIGEVYLNNTKQDVRWDYIRCAPSAMIEVIPFLALGSGFGTASLGYSRSSFAIQTIGTRVNGPYDMENTYLAYFFDTGIVGIILFIIMLVFLIRKYKGKLKNDKSKTSTIIYSFLLASTFSLAFYHYTLFASQMLMFTIALSILDREKGLSYV